MPAEIHCQPIIGENIEANVHSILYKEKESLEQKKGNVKNRGKGMLIFTPREVHVGFSERQLKLRNEQVTIHSFTPSDLNKWLHLILGQTPKTITKPIHNELYLFYLEVAGKLAKEVEEMAHYMGQNKTPEFLFITTSK